MLPKRRRLTSGDVSEVLRHGRSRRSEHLSMKFLPLPSSLQTSAVVAKSVAKSAVERNRLRRAVYQALSSSIFMQNHEATTGQAVIFVQKVPKTNSRQTFADELLELCKNLR